jgi:hypothetical protein
MDQQLNRPAVSASLPPAVFAEGEPVRKTETRDESRGDRLAVRIARVVKRRTAGSVQNLRVEVRRDGVFLDGNCETFYTKQLAQQAAMDLAHEKPLTNRIEVR